MKKKGRTLALLVTMQ